MCDCTVPWQALQRVQASQFLMRHCAAVVCSTCKHPCVNIVKLVLVIVQYAFNLFSHNSPMTGNGYNEEEMKMVNETHKIWGQKDVSITATCIRVPIMRAHAESINLEFEQDISEQEVCLHLTLACHVHLMRLLHICQRHTLHV
jgi:aspartate-semialdehyde dehydrogenase